MASADGLLPGMAFRPDDQDLINRILRPKMAGECLDHLYDRYVHDGDVCSALPSDLVANLEHGSDGDGNPVWYFYSPVRYSGARKKTKARTIDGRSTSWHTEKGMKPIQGTSDVGGYMQDLSHKIKTTETAPVKSRLEEPRWSMKEYGVGGGDFVICKVYKSTYGQSRRVIGSTAVLSEATSNSKNKEKAAGDHPETPASSVGRPTDHDGSTVTMERALAERAEMEDDSAPCSNIHATYAPGNLNVLESSEPPFVRVETEVEDVRFSFETADGNTTFFQAGFTLDELLDADVATWDDLGLGSCTTSSASELDMLEDDEFPAWARFPPSKEFSEDAIQQTMASLFAVL